MRSRFQYDDVDNQVHNWPSLAALVVDYWGAPDSDWYLRYDEREDERLRKSHHASQFTDRLREHLDWDQAFLVGRAMNEFYPGWDGDFYESEQQQAANNLVDALCRNGDPDALEIVVALAQSAPSRRALFDLGAGPLENLVVGHGDRYMDQIVVAASEYPRLKIALSGVWVGNPPTLQEDTVAKLLPWLGEDDTTPFT
jgi:hypothetical protein